MRLLERSALLCADLDVFAVDGNHDVNRTTANFAVIDERLFLAFALIDEKREGFPAVRTLDFAFF